VFWGYMVLPNVFLVFKSFEPWTRDEVFLRSVLPSDRFVFNEENPGLRACPMTDSFGLLSNGDYVLCCLDYEGEMGLGNIASTTVASVLGSEGRARIRADAMTEPLCRRCKGTLFIFQTAPLAACEQAVGQYSRGWWDLEPELYGRGGRWTNGEAWTYVLARIPARSVRVRFSSPHPDDPLFRLEIQTFREEGRVFTLEKSFSFRGRRDETHEFSAAFEFRPGRLYRIVLGSPTFVPDQTLGNGDVRRLGLAVHDLRLRTAAE